MGVKYSSRNVRKGKTMRKVEPQNVFIDWIWETSEGSKGENQKIPEGADLGGKTPDLILN